MPTIEEEQQYRAAREAEHRRQLEERDRFFGNPFRRSQRENAERQDRKERAKADRVEREERRIVEAGARQRAINEASLAGRAVIQQWQAFAQNWSDAVNVTRRERDQAVADMDLDRAAEAQGRLLALARLDKAIEAETKRKMPSNSPTALAERGIIFTGGLGRV